MRLTRTLRHATERHIFFSGQPHFHGDRSCDCGFSHEHAPSKKEPRDKPGAKRQLRRGGDSNTHGRGPHGRCPVAAEEGNAAGMAGAPIDLPRHVLRSQGLEFLPSQATRPQTRADETVVRLSWQVIGHCCRPLAGNPYGPCKGRVGTEQVAEIVSGHNGAIIRPRYIACQARIANTLI